MDTPSPDTPSPTMRPASEKDSPTFRDASHRALSAHSFNRGATTYHEVRPGYPHHITDLVPTDVDVVDIGAGTGKLTETLLSDAALTDSPRAVYAIDPSADMISQLRAHLDVPAWRATAEATGLADAAVGAATCAQTWHWVDVAKACAELDRVVAPGGRVVLAWNTLDTRQPWILRLARIMHSGDIQRPGFVPDVAAPWTITRTVRCEWNDYLRPAQLHALMATRAYWLRGSKATREKMTANLNWYLHERLGFAQDQLLAIPYRSDGFLLERT